MEYLTGALDFAFGHPKSMIGLAIASLISAKFAVHMVRWVLEGLPHLIDDDDAARFEIGLRDSDPEIDLADEIETDLGKLIEAGRWDLVHSLLAAWERDRAATPFGTMFHRLGVEVALKPLIDIAEAEEATGIRPSQDLLDRKVDEFVARLTAAPDDHIAAMLAARAHIAAGWAARGNDWVSGASEADLLRMSHHFQSAEKILARFATRGSALVAEARYFVCLGLEDGGALIRRRYDDWLAIDPDDVTPFQMHGFHLLPRWFGTVDELEAEARRAAEATAPRRGAAGYVIFHGGIMACDDTETRDIIDPQLFVRSALDRARTAGGQWGVNRMAEFLLLAMLDSSGESRQLYRDGLIRLVHDHLRVLIPAAWSSPIDDVRWELARLFKTELEDGARVRVGARGVEILPPDAAAGATAPA